MIIYLAPTLPLGSSSQPVPCRNTKFCVSTGDLLEIAPNRSLPLFWCRHQNGPVHYLAFSLLNRRGYTLLSTIGNILCCTCPATKLAFHSGWCYQLSSAQGGKNGVRTFLPKPLTSFGFRASIHV